MLKKLNTSSIRWFLVGSCTFLIDTSLFLSLFYLTNLSILANVISGVVATSFNYLSHYHWSFSTNQKHIKTTSLYLFFFFLFLFINTFLINFLINQDVIPLLAKVGTAAFLAPFSFLIMKFVTFRKVSNA